MGNGKKVPRIGIGMSLCIVRRQCDQIFNFVRSSLVREGLVREVTLSATNIRQPQTAVNQGEQPHLPFHCFHSNVPEAIGIPIDMLGDISNLNS